LIEADGRGADAFWTCAQDTLERVRASSWDAVVQAGAWVAESLLADRRVLAFGTGHSHLLAEELFARAGGLAAIEAILEPSLMLHEGPLKSSAFERLRDLGRVIWRMRAGGAGHGDTVLVFSNSGRNPVPVELALAARADGARVVAVTSLAHSRSQEPFIAGMPRLFEAADLAIDNGGVPGDAAVRVSGLREAVGATSTVAGALIVQAIACEAAERMTRAGRPPRILRSYNVEVSP
jgi:uncharacterized phosphosugar-binding protein